MLDTPQEPPGKAFPAGLGLGSDEEGPEDAFAMPVRESNGRPVWIYVLAAVAAIVVLVLVFNLLFGGDDGGGEATPTDSGAPVSGQEAIDTMCGHVQQVQVFRDDALPEIADGLVQRLEVGACRRWKEFRFLGFGRPRLRRARLGDGGHDDGRRRIDGRRRGRRARGEQCGKGDDE